MMNIEEPPKTKSFCSRSIAITLTIAVLLIDTRVSGFSAAPLRSISATQISQPAAVNKLHLFATPQEGDEEANPNDRDGNHQIIMEDPFNMNSMTRRSAVIASVASSVLFIAPKITPARDNGLTLQTAPISGLRWADAKVGSGDSPQLGSNVSIDYSMASTAGRFPSIYSTKDVGAPYRWRLGDGSTIQGIELAILGSEKDGITPMKPGGIRRVIVPNSLGYISLIQQSGRLSPASKNKKCLPDNEGSIGPIPPKDASDGAYQRWYQFYCNPRIPYQPDLVLDLKLYGKRGAR